MDARETQVKTGKGLRSAALRIFVLTAAAALVYGGWAFAVNLKHGAAVALRAGGAQGASSATTTLALSALIERLHAARAGKPLRNLIAWLVPSSLGAVLHFGVHVLAGTPNVLVTALPAAAIGFVYSGTYVLGLRRLDASRDRPASAPAD